MGKNEITFADVMDAVTFHVDAGAVNVKQLAQWCGRDERTIYNWLAGHSGPSSREVSLWLQRMPEEVRFHTAVAQLAGSGLHVTTTPGANERASLIGESIEVVQAAAELVTTVNEAQQDRHIDAQERERIRSKAIHVRQQADDVIAATEPRAPRLRAAQ